MKELNKLFGPDIETWDDDEQDRLEHLEEYVELDDLCAGIGGDADYSF